jgi:hypothetical protein
VSFKTIEEKIKKIMLEISLKIVNIVDFIKEEPEAG